MSDCKYLQSVVHRPLRPAMTAEADAAWTYADMWYTWDANTQLHLDIPSIRDRNDSDTVKIPNNTQGIIANQAESCV